MIRVRYFTGQILGTADFETEQRYVVDRLRRRNRWLHGWGVVGGLRVSLSQGQIVVATGLALDCAGNEIEVPRPTAWALPAAGKTCYLTLAFAERPIHPVAVPVDPSSGNAGTEHSRVEEGLVLAYSPEDPARAHAAPRGRSNACGKPHAIAIARLLRARSRWRLDSRYRPGRART